MKTFRIRTLCLLAPAALLGLAPAAGARTAVGISVNLGGLAWGLASGCHGTRVAVVAPPVVYAPAPVVWRTPVVYLPPPPPVILPRPPVVCAPPVFFGPHHSPPPQTWHQPYSHHRTPHGRSYRMPPPPQHHHHHR